MTRRQATPAEARCPDCKCPRHMHFNDGCHTAFGFICRCPNTRDHLENEDTD